MSPFPRLAWLRLAGHPPNNNPDAKRDEQPEPILLRNIPGSVEIPEIGHWVLLPNDLNRDPPVDPAGPPALQLARGLQAVDPSI
jgi:hypothetical protein